MITHTPRTDAELANAGTVSVGFTRTIEAELWDAVALISNLKAEVDRLEAIRGRFVIGHLERICGDCGHNGGEDGCPNCIGKQRDYWEQMSMHSTMVTCLHHSDKERAAARCPVCLMDELLDLKNKYLLTCKTC